MQVEQPELLNLIVLLLKKELLDGTMSPDLTKKSKEFIQAVEFKQQKNLN